MKRTLNILLFIFLSTFTLTAQVAMIAGSYAVASASGSGASGLPTLNYTTSAGFDRLLLFTISYERDHSPTNGSNWANPATTGGASPTVTIGGATMTRLRTSRYFNYATVNVVTDAVMSVELIVYGLLEASIPAGTNTFVVSGINNPLNAGDEAIYTALMFENVDAVNYLASNGCQGCNSIDLPSVTPNDANNMIIGFTTSGSDRAISQGAGYTLVSSNNISNGGGLFTAFSETDGLAAAAQYITGTTSAQTVPFSMSGAADISGNVEVAFRLVSNVLLPVELTSFSVSNADKDNVVSWETSSEINNDYFEIERSSDGFFWESVGKVEGKGTSFEQNNYTHIDENVECMTCYYRLKQVNEDGSYEYSNVEVVKLNKTTDFKIYPNPSTQFFYIESEEEISSATIIDSEGRVVKEINSVFEIGQAINIQDLENGIYIIRVKTSNGFATQRFLKRE